MKINLDLSDDDRRILIRMLYRLNQVVPEWLVFSEPAEFGDIKYLLSLMDLFKHYIQFDINQNHLRAAHDKIRATCYLFDQDA